MTTNTANSNTLRNPNSITGQDDPYQMGNIGGPAAITNATAQGGNTLTGTGDPYGMLGLTRQSDNIANSQAPNGIETGNPYEPAMQTQPADPNAGLFPSNQPGSFGQYAQAQNSGYSGYTPSPYLNDQANAIKTQFNQNLQEQVLPGLRSNFIGSGGLGGSRQGIAEGLAAGRSGQGLAAALANLYGTDYQNSQNRGIQAMGINAQMGANDAANRLGMLNSERNFYSTNRGQDLQQLGLGAGLLGQANQGFLGQGAGLYNLGQIENQAPWQQLQNYSGILQPYTQAGATNSSVGTQQYMYNPTQQWLGTIAQLIGAVNSGSGQAAKMMMGG